MRHSSIRHLVFYTKIRNQTTTNFNDVCKNWEVFYTKIRNQTTTSVLKRSKNLLVFYTKIRNQTTTCRDRVYLSLEYFTPKLEIKPQHQSHTVQTILEYFTPKLEIKPQLIHVSSSHVCSILHQNQKSNHNPLLTRYLLSAVFYTKIRNQTTTQLTPLI